jgi:hypothetical protein
MVRHDRFNYESLQAARTTSATTNFDRFARDLIAHATVTRLTPSTRAFLDHHLVGYDFRTSADLQEQACLSWVMSTVGSLREQDKQGISLDCG